jgi:hypothetical protein
MPALKALWDRLFPLREGEGERDFPTALEGARQNV